MPRPSMRTARRVDARLLAGIMGHNLCLDIFGGPSAEEAAAGLTPHGEASVATYDIERAGDDLVLRAELPLAQLLVERQLTLVDRAVRIRETVESRSGTDRPIGWTQHVTLGPPFLEKGATQFRASATRSKVFETKFGSADYLALGAEFDWPLAPRADGGTTDLRRLHRLAGVERVHHASHGSGAGRRVFRRLCSGVAPGVRLRVVARATFPGWAFGKRTSAGRSCRGLARRSREGWSSACHRCPSRGAR